MLKLIKNIECYSPEYLGKKDIWIADEKIFKIAEPNSREMKSDMINTIDGNGMLAFPGLIDAHVHIIGGGGEDGYRSRIGEIDIQDILEAGITTVVGLLGADDQTKGPDSLLAKARALEEQGITTFIYVGSYRIPPISFTSDLTRDIVLIDKVIGVGEIAISDHRSSNPGCGELIQIASQAHMGGLISGKAGIVHIHVGDGKAGLTPLLDAIKASDIPMEQFLPTHINRNARLFQQATKYCRWGGNIDLTCGEKNGISVPDAVQSLYQSNVNLERVSVSSDSNGSIPSGGVGNIKWLYEDIVKCIIGKKLSPETAFSLVTENVAKRLGLYPRKGVLKECSDADILITDRNFNIKKLLAMGKIRIDKETASGRY